MLSHKGIKPPGPSLKQIEEQVKENRVESVDFKFTPLTTTAFTQLAQALYLNHSVTSLDLWETRYFLFIFLFEAYLIL